MVNTSPLAGRRGLRLYLWIAVLALAAMIFFFSSQPGESSSGLSDLPARWLMELLDADFQARPIGEQQQLYQLCQLVVRKIGHFGEFALLAFHLCLLLECYALRHSGLFCWLLTTLYAASDEFHQLFVDARSARWQDVLIDSSGAFCGAAAALLLVLLLLRHSLRKRTEPGPA